MPAYPDRTAVVLLTLSLLCACARPPAESAANSPDSQKLPFDRQSRSTGVSPSQSMIPSATKLPEGIPIPVRLQNALSSATSHAGDTFNAITDEPVVIDGQTLVPAGTPATGRVLEAKPSRRSLESGDLRIVLVSLKIGGKEVMIETSSIFAKGGSRENRAPAGASQKDVAFSVDRRLNFRLAQSVDLP
jgi:hypothetical protein